MDRKKKSTIRKYYEDDPFGKYGTVPSNRPPRMTEEEFRQLMEENRERNKESRHPYRPSVYFRDKADMVNYFGLDYFLKGNRSIEMYWARYENRKELIMSGEYDELKTDEYRRNIVSAFRRAMAEGLAGEDEDEAKVARQMERLRTYEKTLENMDLDTLVKLFAYADNRNDSRKGKLFPSLDEIYALFETTGQLSAVERDIRRALSAVGVQNMGNSAFDMMSTERLDRYFKMHRIYISKKGKPWSPGVPSAIVKAYVEREGIPLESLRRKR